MSSLVGRTLGQYEIVDVLGRGGMATVYLGHQKSIDRHVAVKVLPPHPALDEAFKERFQLEAKTIGSLQNPNILPLYDYGTFDDVIYLVMQHVDGGTLEDKIEMGPMSVMEVERIIRSVASGLDYAHSKGVIHRDIKPGNILIQDNHPLLADFGMVKMVSGDSNLTGTSIVGTPSYMAPEQGQGLDVDHRVDVYALVAIAYEMLTGQRPFSGTTPMQMILAHINDTIPDVRKLRPDLSDEIQQVLRRGLAKLPENRYQSAGEFAEAFSRAIHKNDDSLAGIQKDLPIGSTDDVAKRRSADLAATAQFDSPPPSITGATPITGTTPTGMAQMGGQPTQVIVRDSVNPFVLMGGFGLIAIVIVVVAVLLINPNNNNNTVATDVVNATDDTLESTDTPTDIPVVIPSPEDTFGEVRFSSDSGYGDRVEVRLRAVDPPSGDDDYVAWLLNTETEEILKVGRVILDSQRDGTATFTDEDGRTLPAIFNAVIVTEDSADAETPSDVITYSALLPIEVTNGLTEIFVASENGLNGNSLLDGAQTEARFASQHAGLAAGASNIGGLRSHAEHTINILRGEEEDYDGSGRGSNPGRGVGVFFFLDAIETLLAEATSLPDATLDLQSNAEFIRTCTQNVRDWSNEIIELEVTMIAGEDLEAVLDETERSTILADQLQTGVDLNENGTVDAFEGECGLEQIQVFGLQYARMDILEGDLPE